MKVSEGSDLKVWRLTRCNKSCSTWSDDPLCHLNKWQQKCRAGRQERSIRNASLWNCQASKRRDRSRVIFTKDRLVQWHGRRKENSCENFYLGWMFFGVVILLKRAIWTHNLHFVSRKECRGSWTFVWKGSFTHLRRFVIESIKRQGRSCWLYRICCWVVLLMLQVWSGFYLLRPMHQEKVTLWRRLDAFKWVGKWAESIF